VDKFPTPEAYFRMQLDAAQENNRVFLLAIAERDALIADQAARIAELEAAAGAKAPSSDG
jgi:hypothetical protein